MKMPEAEKMQIGTDLNGHTGQDQGSNITGKYEMAIQNDA